MNSPLTKLRLPLSLMLMLAAGGCGASGKSSVPKDAMLVAERSGGLVFAARDSGSVYITNKNSGKLVYSGEVTFGDKLLFYPENKRVILNGNVVKEDPGFDPKQVHRLYFLKG